MALTTDPKQLRGCELVDAQGMTIGHIEALYVDQETRGHWAFVDLELFGKRGTLVPLTDAMDHGAQVRVPFTKDQISEAPDVDADRELDQQEEARLYRYYELAYSVPQSTTGGADATAGADGEVGAAPGVSTTRTEGVASEQRSPSDSGARLRKLVESDPQTPGARVSEGDDRAPDEEQVGEEMPADQVPRSVTEAAALSRRRAAEGGDGMGP